MMSFIITALPSITAPLTSPLLSTRRLLVNVTHGTNPLSLAHLQRIRSAAGKSRSFSPAVQVRMTLTFYHVPESTSSITEAVLAELGTPHDLVEMSITAGDTRKPEFLALNPNGRVPVVVHDGTPIWESAAITMYLGEVFGVAGNVFPAPGPARGEAMKWIVWSNVCLAEAAGRLAGSLPVGTDGAVVEGSRDFVPAEEIPVNAAEKARSDLAGILAVLNGGLEGKDFLVGEYSLADTHVQALVGWASSMDVPLEGFSHVEKWLGRCGERPALAKLMEKYAAGMDTS